MRDRRLPWMRGLPRTWTPLIRQRQWLREQRLSRPGAWQKRRRRGPHEHERQVP